MTTFIFDFDSTVISVESLDEIIALSLTESCASESERIQKMAEIEAITNRGMNGEIDLSESLRLRLALAKVHQRHIDLFVQRLKTGELLTVGLADLFDQLRAKHHQILLISGGFKICLEAVCPLLGLSSDQTFGNSYALDADGFLISIDPDNPLSTTEGKVVVIDQLKCSGFISGKTCMIGDGMSDYKPFEKGVVDQFIGFGIHKKREEVRRRAPLYADSMESFQKILISVSDSL